MEQIIEKTNNQETKKLKKKKINIPILIIKYLVYIDILHIILLLLLLKIIQRNLMQLLIS